MAFEVPKPPSSGLAKYFTALRSAASVEERMDASLSDVTDSSLRSMHVSAEGYKPDMKRLWTGVSQADRCETLDWLVQAFGVMHFTDAALIDTVIILDRHSASSPAQQVSSAVSQRTLLAAVCIALKMGSREDAQLPLRQVVTHLGRDAIPFDDILTAELQILPRLRFCVATPSPYDFLETLSVRLSDYGRRVRSLAHFLVQLSLIEPDICYRYAHSVLAGAAFSLSLLASEAPEEAYVVLAEDLCLFSTATPQEQLSDCITALHNLWADSIAMRVDLFKVYVQHLMDKFKTPAYHFASGTQPPEISRQGLAKMLKPWSIKRANLFA